MALKTLMLRKKLQQEEKTLAELREEKEKLNQEEEELKEAIEELDEESSDEERATVEDAVNELTNKVEQHDSRIKEVESTVEKIKAEIELEEEETTEEDVKEVEEARSTDSSRNNLETRGRVAQKLIAERGETMHLETRKVERVQKLLQRQENLDFFNDLRKLYTRAAALGGLSTENAQLLLPEQIIFEINQRVGEYGSLYNLVRKINLTGHARIIMNTDTVKMYWTEKCEPLKEVTLGELRQVELDNFKLGGYLFLCEAFVEDFDANNYHSITMADFILNEFAKGIAQALDEAIYNGKGAGQKEPEGIATAVTKVTQVKSILDVLGVVGKLDLGFYEHNASDGTITIAGNRSTLYEYIYPETWGKDANGRLVYGMGNALPDGTRIELSNVIPDGELVIGDFSQYVLGIRKEMAFDTNDRLQWIEENTGYKIRGRYDGKVTNPEAFARVSFATKASTSTTSDK